MQLHKDSKQQIGMETHLDNYKHAKSGNVNLCKKKGNTVVFLQYLLT